jgi:SPP1 gp7 family putative phage head morphogenesis protein
MSSCGIHTNRELSGDPTNTQDLREAFETAIRKRYRELRGAILRTIGYDQDAFELVGNKIDAGGPYDFPTDKEQVEAFMRDLQEWIQEHFLEPVGFGPKRDGRHWSGQYIRGAYARGWQNAEGRLQQVGMSVSSSSVEEVLEVPVAVSQLKNLYIRAFERLEGFTDDLAQTVREQLTLGLGQGKNPNEIARDMRKELGVMGKTRPSKGFGARLQTIARTEIINSYSDATVSRYRRAGVDGVSLSGEFSTAGDSRVCPICEALEGDVFSLTDFEQATFEYEPSEDEPDSLADEYSVKPPIHPNCRCAILPVVGG